MRNDIKKLLGLQHLWVDHWEITDKRIEVKVRSPRTFAMCPHCMRSVKRVHQYKLRIIKHSIWQERKIILRLTTRRFYCNVCKKAFQEYIPGIDKRRTTDNFRRLILKDLARSSLSYVKQMTDISPTVLYSVLKENYEKTKNINWAEQGENITLGIDEHSYRGRNLVLTVTNISQKKLLLVGKDDRLSTVRNFLAQADKSRIKEVCIDMKKGYLNVIKEQLPNAKITVDKFHVVAYANKNLDDVRDVIVGKGRHVRQLLFKGQEKLSDKEKLKLSALFKQYQTFPSLKEAYFIKEKLRDFYRLTDKKEARRKFARLILFCENSQSRYTQGIGKTLLRWKDYILNYFDYFSTNAFTEGVHTKIKMIKRVSFGFRNIAHYIAKVSLAFLPLLCLNQHTIC